MVWKTHSSSHVAKHKSTREWRLFFCLGMGYKMSWIIVRVSEDVVCFGHTEGVGAGSRIHGSDGTWWAHPSWISGAQPLMQQECHSDMEVEVCQ